MMTLRFNINNADRDFVWDRLYVDTKLPWDIDFSFGRFHFDWEGDRVLYDPYTINNDATFGDWNVDGFQLAKTWGNFSVTLLAAQDPKGTFDAQNGAYTWTDSNNIRINHAGHEISDGDYMVYAGRLDYSTENWMIGAMAYMLDSVNEDPAKAGSNQIDLDTYGVYAGYSFTPAIQLKGVYYWQDIEGFAGNLEDSPTAWKAILDVKQDLLKFTASGLSTRRWTIRSLERTPITT